MKKLSNSTIINTINLDFAKTYENFKLYKKVSSLDITDKGLITCRFKNPDVLVEISGKGKVNIYYNPYYDLIEAVNLLNKLMVCDSFSIEADIPRKLGTVDEGIKTHLGMLIEPDLLHLSEVRKYIRPTTKPKTFRAVAEGLNKYLMLLLETRDHDIAIREMENSKRWIVTFVTPVDNVDYVKECDRLRSELTSALEESPYDFRICEDHRDGEGFSLRYIFKWCPADGPLDGPSYPDRWELAKLEPFSEIYPDSDPSEMYDI